MGQSTKNEIGFTAFYDRVNHSYIKFKGLTKEHLLYKNAFSFQAVYGCHISNTVSLLSGAGYSRRGFRNENTDYSADYIQFSEYVGIEIIDNKMLMVSPYTGIYLGLPVHTGITIKNNDLPDEAGRGKADLGLEGGIRMGIKLDDRYDIHIIPRFQFGLSEVYRKYDFESRRNLAFSMGVGITRKF
ncbi:hypothetical protein CHA01nite_24150 [Chryseobacterium hagamense]|uniref:Outer membrane protein beta-barrel domain-containing protein n=2 Tax=Chryseobacterium hagamense TaxID=395935 RepID=A0A511YNB2_9FLAO|nr:hypothetical protein CHA01nite_24150 [Chryseobacterium hagamense]